MSECAENDRPIIAAAAAIAPRAQKTIYPEPFAARMAGREKRALGDFFGLTRFGVNLTTLAPGGESALLHRHSLQEEFIFIVEGHPTLVTDRGDFSLAPGMCAGFPPNGIAHHLVNRSADRVVYLEIGDRPQGDRGEYPCEDLAAEQGEGGWRFTHRDGRPY